MDTLSPFQLIPPHVVQLIVNHVVGSSRLVLDGVKPDSVEYKKLLRPLSQVCDNFRAIACSLYYSDYKVYIYVRSDKVDIEECSWTNRVYSLDDSDCLISREIQLRVHVCDIYDGHALQQLTTKPYDDWAFPLARKLVFDLVTECSWNEDSEYTFEGADANIMAFVQRIKEMTPRVNTVHLGITDMDGKLISRSGTRMRFLLLNLNKLAETTLLTNGCLQLLKCPDLAPVCKLVHIDCKIKEDAHQILQLARVNAQVLETIDIRSDNEVDISGLVRDPDNGKYAEYSCLCKLTLRLAGISVGSQRSTFEGAIPFPSLRHLALNYNHPFGDDVVFRGNTTTLEYLKLHLTAEFVTLLTKHNVFTPTSHPKLQYVNVYLPSSFDPDEFAEASSCLQFGNSIAPAASVRNIVGHGFVDEVIPQNISLLGSNDNIQCLSLPHTTLSFTSIATLIKTLPLLSDLYTSPPNSDALPRGIKEQKLPEYVQTTYAPMGERFRCWHVSNESYPRVLATCVLLLALVCPNFNHVDVESSCREALTYFMEWQMALPEFDAYTRRLKRQLYGKKRRYL